MIHRIVFLLFKDTKFEEKTRVVFLQINYERK